MRQEQQEKTLYFAIQEARQFQQPLYILFIREQKVITHHDTERTWLDDAQACDLFDMPSTMPSMYKLNFSMK